MGALILKIVTPSNSLSCIYGEQVVLEKKHKFTHMNMKKLLTPKDPWVF
jgi:hypothetical protein